MGTLQFCSQLKDRFQPVVVDIMVIATALTMTAGCGQKSPRQLTKKDLTPPSSQPLKVERADQKRAKKNPQTPELKATRPWWKDDALINQDLVDEMPEIKPIVDLDFLPSEAKRKEKNPKSTAGNEPNSDQESDGQNAGAQSAPGVISNNPDSAIDLAIDLNHRMQLPGYWSKPTPVQADTSANNSTVDDHEGKGEGEGDDDADTTKDHGNEVAAQNDQAELADGMEQSDVAPTSEFLEPINAEGAPTTATAPPSTTSSTDTASKPSFADVVASSSFTMLGGSAGAMLGAATSAILGAANGVSTTTDSIDSLQTGDDSLMSDEEAEDDVADEDEQKEEEEEIEIVKAAVAPANKGTKSPSFSNVVADGSFAQTPKTSDKAPQAALSEIQWTMAPQSTQSKPSFKNVSGSSSSSAPAASFKNVTGRSSTSASGSTKTLSVTAAHKAPLKVVAAKPLQPAPQTAKTTIASNSKVKKAKAPKKTAVRSAKKTQPNVPFVARQQPHVSQNPQPNEPSTAQDAIDFPPELVSNPMCTVINDAVNEHQGGRPVARPTALSVAYFKAIVPLVKKRGYKMNSNVLKENHFICTLLPIIFRMNKQVWKQRLDLVFLKQKMDARKSLNTDEQQWLVKMKDAYRLNRNADIEALLERVDLVPVGFLLAQAAHESNWGTSAIARSNLNFFGRKALRSSGDGRYKRYSSVEEGISDQISYINSRDFKFAVNFRNERTRQRKAGRKLDNPKLAVAIRGYATDKKYVQKMHDYFLGARNLNRYALLEEHAGVEGAAI